MQVQIPLTAFLWPFFTRSTTLSHVQHFTQASNFRKKYFLVIKEMFQMQSEKLSRIFVSPAKTVF